MSRKHLLLSIGLLVILVVTTLTKETSYAQVDPLMPEGYYLTQHEYRVSTTGLVCLPGGIIGIKITPQNGRTANARMKIETKKCDGSAFSQGGNYYILLDGQRKWGPFNFNPGGTVLTQYISPYTQYGIERQHNYQVQLYSNGDPNTAKYTGVVQAAAWGRCWCTDFVKQKFNLTGNVPNAKDFGPYLINNGFRVLTSSEVPRPGDVAVLQPSFPGASEVGHVGFLEVFNTSTWKFTLRQGGSATDGWFDDSFCYNTRLQAFGTSAQGRTDIKFYRR